MNYLVKILQDDFGEPREEYLQYWHYVIHKGGNQTLCESEYFGDGESGCVFETKTVTRGGITCPNCLEEIKRFKAIKL